MMGGQWLGLTCWGMWGVTVIWVVVLMVVWVEVVVVVVVIWVMVVAMWVDMQTPKRVWMWGSMGRLPRGSCMRGGC